MRLNFRENIGVHNKYALELRDASTGELKQTAEAENVVLNALWTDTFAFTATTIRLLNGVAMGTGSGTPAATDAALFTPAFTYDGTFSTVSLVDAYPTSAYTYRIDIPADAQYTGNLTEIGLRAYNNRYVLWTHALLKDSEGNPIVIEKTDLDILTITCTLYITLGATDSNFHWYTPGTGNGICQFFRNANNQQGSPFRTSPSYLAHCGTCLLDDNGCISAATSQSDARLSGATYSGTAKTFGVPSTRLSANAGNVGYYNGLCLRGGLGWLGGVVYPNENIFPNQTLENMTVGVGDGTTTNFAVPIEYFVEDTDVVKIDDVELTRGVDYTIDNINTPNTYNDTMSISNFLQPISGIDVSMYPSDWDPYNAASAYMIPTGNSSESTAPYTCIVPFTRVSVSPAAACVKSSQPIIYKVTNDCPYTALRSITASNLNIAYPGYIHYMDNGSVPDFVYFSILPWQAYVYDNRPMLSVPVITDVYEAAPGPSDIVSLIASNPSMFTVANTANTLVTRINGKRFGMPIRIIHPVDYPIYYTIVNPTAVNQSSFLYCLTEGDVEPFGPNGKLIASTRYGISRQVITVNDKTWTCYVIMLDYWVYPEYARPSYNTAGYSMPLYSSAAELFNGCKLVLSGGLSANGPWTELLSQDLSNPVKLNSNRDYMGIPDACCTCEPTEYTYYKLELDTTDATHPDVANPDIDFFLNLASNTDYNKYSEYVATLSLGYSGGLVRFVAPPAAGSVITLDADIDRPYKNSNFVIDAAMTLKF